jgi:hypothetical protein
LNAHLLIIKAFKDCQSAQKTCSFPDSLALLSHLSMGGQVIPTQGQIGWQHSLILDEDIAFTGDLPGRVWGADLMHHVLMSWRESETLIWICLSWETGRLLSVKGSIDGSFLAISAKYWSLRRSGFPYSFYL